MSVLLPQLAPIQLEAIADWLDRSRSSRVGAEDVTHLSSSASAREVAAELQRRLSALGSQALATLLRVVAAERRSATESADRRLELVWTGPEREGAGTRDTSVVVRELFQRAADEVLVACFALFNARPIFTPLVDRMRERPQMRVRIFLNVARSTGDFDDEVTVREYARTLRTLHWPEGPLPEFYFDPRSLARDASRRAVMHAKCVLVDGTRMFITSANFTEAAHERNIELGIVINDATLYRAVRQQFDDLVESGVARRLDVS